MGMSPRLRKISLITASIILLALFPTISSHGQSVNYYYDDLNRLTRIDYGDMVID